MAVNWIRGTRLGSVIALAIAAATAALPTRADTDYRCLTDCVHEGNSGTACLANCSYPGSEAPPQGPEGGQILKQSEHSPLTAPAPVTNVIVVQPVGTASFPAVTAAGKLSPTTQPLGPSTNLKCVRSCLAGGYQYGLCVMNCSY